MPKESKTDEVAIAQKAVDEALQVYDKSVKVLELAQLMARKTIPTD